MVHQLLIFLLITFQGKLESGEEFDSSIPRGDPFVFTLGAGQVIKGKYSMTGCQKGRTVLFWTLE